MREKRYFSCISPSLIRNQRGLRVIIALLRYIASVENTLIRDAMKYELIKGELQTANYSMLHWQFRCYSLQMFVDLFSPHTNRYSLTYLRIEFSRRYNFAISLFSFSFS